MDLLSSKELRPLAHLNIQDQTVATAIMLCLADAVESHQGSTDPEDHHDVCSYGNHLFCDWKGNQARFRWGNGSTYSKYFEDYQRFLERQIRKAEERQRSLSPGDGIYEIHLDLSAFYDCIDRARLIQVLKGLANEFYDTEPEQSKDFWKMVRKTIHGWRWAQEDGRLSGCLKDGLPKRKGIPQGLVASGFFANAYLLDLDRQLSLLVGKKFGEVTLSDYCRYVDDLRLLVVVHDGQELNWNEWVEKTIQPVVHETKGLKLNSDKTKVERYTAKRSGVSVRMKAIQQSVSGPLDSGALNMVLGSLEGLFTLAEQFRDQTELTYRGCDLPLAWVDHPQIDCARTPCCVLPPIA